MPNFKKFVALSLGAVCLLSSCNHVVDATGAKKFIKENYTGTDTFKEIESLQYSFKVTCSDNKKSEMIALVKEAATDVGCTDKEYTKDSLSFTCAKIKKDSEVFEQFEEDASYRINEAMIDASEESKKDGAKIVYTTSGKEISLYGSMTTKNKVTETTTQLDNTDIFADNGHIRYRRTYTKVTHKDYNYTITATSIATQTLK